MKNITTNIFLAFIAFASLPLNADVFVLKNGDKITGEVASKTEDKTSVQTPYALIEIPNTEIVSVTAQKPTDKKQEELAKEALSEKPAEEAVAQKSPANAGAPAEGAAEEKSFIDEYKDF
ncbi:MAG: hypothetical protein J6R08_03130, partial [Opitutales bacterium]|nr:hypothetical protein [Opitutales bacterium]